MTVADRPIVVTGAGGYLGGRISAALDGQVRAVARQRVPWLPVDAQTPADLLAHGDTLTAAFAGAAAVIHLAGHNEVLARTDPERAVAETVAATQNVIDAARAGGPDRIVYVSTIHVYGAHLEAGATIAEDLPPRPLSAYAEARAASEELLMSASGLDPVILRLSNAVGAPADPTVDRWTLVASELSLGAVLDRTMVLRSPGLQTRDFITLEDASRIIVAAVAGLPGGIYNLASGRSISIRELADLIGERVEHLCGYRPALSAPPADGPSEVPYTFDVSALAAHGLRAEQAVQSGVDELIEHCRKHREELRMQRGTP